MKYLSLLLYMACCLCYGQDTIRIHSLNKYFKIDPIYLSEGLEAGTVSIENIQEKKFQLQTLSSTYIGKEYWSSFHLQPNSNLRVSILEFSFPLADNMVVYYPLKQGGYGSFSKGLTQSNPKIYEMEQTSMFTLESESLDFQRPFFVMNMPMTIFGLSALDSPAFVVAYNGPALAMDPDLKRQNYTLRTFEFEYVLLLGMIMISFVFMLVHYVISKHIYFLFYSLYLFFLIFNYGYRTFYFYNLYSVIHQNLYFYFNQNGQLLSFLFYMLFVKFFVDMRHNYPKFNKIYNGTLWLFIVFILVYNTIIIVNPYFAYHEIIMKTAIYFLTFLSLVFVIYMFFKKRLVHTAVVFIGSLVLLTGYITALVIRNFFVLVPLVVVETIFFISVIAYLDLHNFKNSLMADKLREIDEFKTRFFTNISHEFLTPLSLISGPLEDQLLSEKLSGSQRKNLSAAYRNIERLKELVNQLLALARVESGRYKLNVQSGNISKFIRSHAAAFNFQCAEKHIDYRIEVSIEEQEDWFDHEIVEMVFYNLMGNALKYTSENGKIYVHGSRDGHIYKLGVCNSGKEIPREVQQRIFERFYQDDTRNPGAGIGLSLTKELIELHKGSIVLNCEVNGLTEFWVSLPIVKECFQPTEILNLTSSREAAVPYDHSGSGPENERPSLEDTRIILIVDDNEDICEYVGSLFETSSAVHKASDGLQGYEMATSLIPDIVISDVMMPEEDGFALTKKLKEHELTAHIPIILLTAKTQDSSKLEAMGMGADAYITKPFNSRLLKATVENLIESRKNLQKRFSREIVLMPMEISISSADEIFLERLNKVLDQHLTDPDFSVEQFGAKMGVSRMQLHRKLKALTGRATTEFLRIQRLHLALKLLENEKISVAEVAYAVGFNDPSYFSRCFKQEYGYAPSEYPLE